MEQFDINELVWTREPKEYSITDDSIEMITKPHTDLWQRTYYHFRNDNAPVLQMKTDEKYFSFVVKTEFKSKHRFDQCGVVMYLDSENWLKASIEYENDFCIECSEDGIRFKQMRICHMWEVKDEITFGIYACSPEDSSFKATFTNMEITECKWLAHDGQKPDEE